MTVAPITIGNRFISGSVDSDYIPDNLPLYNEILEIVMRVGTNVIDDRGFTIQVNAQYRSTSSDPKPDGGRVNGGKNTSHGKNGIYWLTLHNVTLEVIRRLIESSFVLRFGIKLNGTSYRDNFVSSDFVYADIDSGCTIQESLDNEFVKQYACALYKTPSYTESNQKHRLLFRLDETVKDPIIVYAIYLYLLDIFPYFDKSIKDPARIMYGSFQPLVFINSDNCLKVQELLASPAFDKFIAIAQVNIAGSQEFTLVNELANNYHKPLIEKLQNDFNWDLNAFMKALGDDFDYQWRRDQIDHQSIIAKWEGFNPYSESNSSGSSFVCSIKDDKILFYARNGSGGASLFDHLDCLAKGLKNLIPYSLDNKGFRKLRNEICEKLGIPIQSPYDYSFFTFDEKNDVYRFQPHLFIAYFWREYKGRLEFSSKTRQFHWYNEALQLWQELDRVMLLVYVKQYLRVLIGNDVADGVLTAKAAQDMIICLGIPDIDLIVYEPLEHDFKYVPYSNGAYDLVTKRLIGYSPSIRNTFVLSHSYQQSTGAGIKAFRNLFHQILESPESIDYLINWMIAFAQYKGERTRHALGLVGTPNSGKSTLTEWLTRMMDDSTNLSGSSITAYEKAAILTNTSDRFANAALMTAKCLVLTEFSGIMGNQDGGVLKDLIGMNRESQGALMSFEVKRVQGRFKKLVNLAVIANSQEYPIFPVKDKGWDRRFLWIKFQKLDYHIDDFDLVYQNFVDLHCWLVEQTNVDEIVKSFDTLSQQSWALEASNNRKSEQDKQWRFIDECIEFTGLNIDRIESQRLYQTYVQFCQESGERNPLSKVSFAREIKLLLQTRYDWQPPNIGSKEGNDYVKVAVDNKRYYLKIKFVDELNLQNYVF